MLARAQRELGCRAWSVCYRRSEFGFAVDETFGSPVSDHSLGWLRFLLTRAARFGVFQFYYGESLLGPLLWDVPLLKLTGRKVFLHFCGCDLRDAKRVIASGAGGACECCWPMACARRKPRAKTAAMAQADGIFVSTPDLLEFAPDAELLPQPVDLAALDATVADSPERPGADRPVRVAHAPSDRTIKGTAHVVSAVERLRDRGVAIELVLIEGRSHREAARLCATCDLAVDQLLVGSYGRFAVEMMALGKPVICHLRGDLRRFYPRECPIIPAGVDDIGVVIADVAASPESWAEWGRRGRAYVEAVHDSRAVAAQSLQAYRRKGAR